MPVLYTSNNSGGSSWLSIEDWRDLSHGGWDVIVCEVQDIFDESINKRDKFDGYALLENCDDEEFAQAHWKYSMKNRHSPFESGCECCGTPHNFSNMEYCSEYFKNMKENR